MNQVSICLAAVVALVDADSTPLPFPLPANFSVGLCGSGHDDIPGCATSVRLANQISIRCSTEQGCDPSCQQSALSQGAFSRYEARLGGGVSTQAPNAKEWPVPQARKGQQYWWRLNNTNCDQHDLPGSCEGLSIMQCQSKCETTPDCGAFLFYSKTRKYALKNSTCWDDVGPLPTFDDGDDLFIMRPVPPAPPQGSTTLSTVDVCVSDSSESLGKRCYYAQFFPS